MYDTPLNLPVSALCLSVHSPDYSQCLPTTVTTGPTTFSTPVPPPTTPVQPTTPISPTTTGPASPSGTCAPNSPPDSAGTLRFAGINISGFDFGCNTDGDCTVSGAWPPLLQYYGHDGAGQMQHFVNDDGFNVFRLPVGWQFLINDDDTPGGTLDAANLAEYDALVQACLATGASCIVDVHNYARFNGGVCTMLYEISLTYLTFYSRRSLDREVPPMRSLPSCGPTSPHTTQARRRSSSECELEVSPFSDRKTDIEMQHERAPRYS